MPSPSPEQPAALNAPLRDLNEWVAYFRYADIPVLQETAIALEHLRENQDAVDANNLGELIASDPLMTLKVLAYASQHRGRRVITGVETVTAALVMMGISPFFAVFGPQTAVEDLFVDQPEALDGLAAVLKRAERGAMFALAFAVHRMSPDAALIHAVTLLHEFAELLLWCKAPKLAMIIRDAQRNDSTLRSSVIQQAVLNVELALLQEALVRAWHLPKLLAHVTDPDQRESSAVKIIELATRLARHSTQGWENAALPDDIAEVCTLLNLSTAAAFTFVRDI